jgi:hypothetical protein
MRLTAALRSMCVAVAASAICCAAGITDLNQISGSGFGSYGLIVESNASNSLSLSSSTTINGSVALGSPTNGSAMVQGNGATINGNVDFAAGSLSAGTMGATVSGSINPNVTNAANAVSDAMSLSSSYGAVTGSLLTGTGAVSLNVATNPGGEYNSESNEHVYSLSTSSKMTSITITAAAGQYVVINVGAGSSKNWSLIAVTLSGGITADDVLFNVLTTGNLTSGNAQNDTINADVIDLAGNVNINQVTLNGRLACNIGNQSCTVGSNTFLYQPSPSGSQSGGDPPAPEPVTFTLAGAGLLALAFGLRRVKARRSSQ